jgi:FkbM family methyltransferase
VPKIFVGIPAYGDIPAVTVQCIVKLCCERLKDASLIVRLNPGDSLVSRARNRLTADFLATDATHLLFIDSDLIFSAEHINRLLAHDESIIGGFYPKKQDGKLEWVCNAHFHFPPPDERELQSLRYIGTGFMLIKREVFEKMIDIYGHEIRYTADGTGREEYDFWTVGVYRDKKEGPGRHLSEDWFFCQRALDLGYKVLGDTKVILKHWGNAAYPLKSQEAALLGEYLTVCPADMKPHMRKIFEGEYQVPLKRDPELVLDLGANIGGFSVWAARKWPNAKIVAYEPHPDNAALFRMNTAEFGERVELHVAAVRETSCLAKLLTADTNIGARSFYYPEGKAELVKCVAASMLPAADFIKIDTEGSELEILQGLNLSRAGAVVLEYHGDEDIAPISDLLSGFNVEHSPGELPQRGIVRAVR